MVKPSGVQRESDGVVVPMVPRFGAESGVQHNAPGGKGPDFDDADRVGKREGMTGVGWSNYLGTRSGVVAAGGDSQGVVLEGRPSRAKVQQLQRRLWAAAKQSEGRRFHALYDRVHRGDVLWEAWKRVSGNRGAAGVDRVTLAFVEDEYGVERLLAELQRALRSGSYRPAPARRVDIPKPAREGREGFDFLGCHFHARMSGRLWEQKRVIRYYLHRWPAQAAMKRLREKVRDRTGRNRAGARIEWVIEDLNPILRGWGNYFRTGNAATKFGQIDDYVYRRLRRLQIKKRGRNLHAGVADQWTSDWFVEKGLYRLRGTVRYPKAA